MMLGKIGRVTLILSIFAGLLLSIGQGGVQAAGSVDRTTTIIVPYTEYEWWLVYWSDNSVACQFYIDYEGLPYPDDVLYGCGEGVYDYWMSVGACSNVNTGGDTSSCPGLYLHLKSSQYREREVLVKLPPPVVWIQLHGCDPVEADSPCTQQPSLSFYAEEPLPNEEITAVHVKVGYAVTSCDGASCIAPLPAESVELLPIQFWADSSFGDSSQKFTGTVRIIKTENAEQVSWSVDIASTQWKSVDLPTCAMTWDSLIPVEGPPSWLKMPDQSEELASEKSYYYLAGRLLSKGLVDASICPGGGIRGNGYATECGKNISNLEVISWQNTFDARIFEVAHKTGLPAQVLKNMIAQETQFWPGIYQDFPEYGLGALTEMGADTLLLWDIEFFNQFCPLVLSEGYCRLGYAQLPGGYQAFLRGALASRTNSDCANCTYGIDLEHANDNIETLAQIVIANCTQVGQTIHNLTNKTAGSLSSYDDLWRFTMVTYNAGIGCLYHALDDTLSTGKSLKWVHVAPYLETTCPGAVIYVENVTRE
jgi:hypothetical protein